MLRCQNEQKMPSESDDRRRFRKANKWAKSQDDLEVKIGVIYGKTSKLCIQMKYYNYTKIVIQYNYIINLAYIHIIHHFGD